MVQRVDPFKECLLGPGFKIETEWLHLYILQGTQPKTLLSRKQGEVRIVLKNDFDPTNRQMQIWLNLVLIEQLRTQAKHFLLKRLDELATFYQLRYNKGYIKNVSSRWGSCSGGGNVNLSLWLMMVPRHLAEYVIKHELAHLNEMNHGPRFWAEVDKMTDGMGKKLEKEMNQFSRQMSLLFRCIQFRTKGYRLS